MNIPPFKSMHYLHGVMISLAIWTIVAILVPWLIVKPGHVIEASYAIGALGIMFSPFIGWLYYAMTSNQHLPPVASKLRILNLPEPGPHSTDWAYDRAYYALANSSAEPFTDVTIRAEDLNTLLERLVKAEGKI